MKLRHDLLLVTWDDAGELGLGWVQDSEVFPKEMLVHTIGFCLRKTKTHIVLASTVSEPYANHAQFQIPVKMVKKIDILGKKGTEFPYYGEAEENKGRESGENPSVPTRQDKLQNLEK